MELLSPAGNMEKLMAALHFGADAVYLAGKRFSLRAFSDNFSDSEMKEAVNLVHSQGKKAYVAMNIFAHDTDFDGMTEYIKFLQSVGADAVIVSDLGILSLIKKQAPDMEVHVSTQANVTNKYAAMVYADMGVKRLVLARELTLNEIKRIRDYLPAEIELEAFVHGAMCISYSGRCLMSDFMAGRHSNLGECAQSCRWEYAVAEKTRGEYMPVEEDERGTYIFNSKDMNMIDYLPLLIEAGIDSFKIEGRVKSAYYVACVTNAYRRALDLIKSGKSYELPDKIREELYKTSHRNFCTGFYLGEKAGQSYESSKATSDYDFCAVVLESKEDGAVVEMRNRFRRGDVLEALSAGECDGAVLTVDEMTDEDGRPVEEALKVQQRLYLRTPIKLRPWDMLRKKK